MSEVRVASALANKYPHLGRFFADKNNPFVSDKLAGLYLFPPSRQGFDVHVEPLHSLRIGQIFSQNQVPHFLRFFKFKVYYVLV
mgnify:CR=1 FL=1